MYLNVLSIKHIHFSRCLSMIASMVIILLLFVSCGGSIENIEEREFQEKRANTPEIESISPAFGNLAGGTIVTITGEKLDKATKVQIGNTCTITAQSSEEITCTTTATSAGLESVILINEINNLKSASSNSFRYLAPPTLSNIDPAASSTAGDELITITGTGFYDSEVTIDGEECEEVKILSDTSITCLTPPHAAETVDVVLTNPDGQTATASSALTYELPPIITSFSPTTIYEVGGQSLTISGSNFQSGANVTIGGSDCNVTAHTPTSITCDTPSGSGNSAVIVTNPSGVKRKSTIEYIAPPIITSFTPTKGKLTGSDVITINGENFTEGGSFNISTAGVTCASTNLISATQVTCTTTSSGATSGNIVVTNNDGQSATLGTFEYRGAPTISGITPNSGALAGGTIVTITGTSFDTSNVAVTLGGSACTNVSVASATSLTCTTPAHSAGAVTLQVTNTEDLQSASSTGAYNYYAAPVVTSASLNYGPIAGGNTITINGTDFQSGATASIDGVACTSVTFNGATSIYCDVPSKGSTGSASITVTNPDGQTHTLSDAYTYRNAPQISSLSASAGPTAGGQTLTLTGTDFMANLSVSINSMPCQSVTVLSETSAECLTPDNSGAGGPFDIDITNQDGQASSLNAAYEYINPPTVSSISPAFGDVAGGTTVTVTGSDFYVAGGITATIDGVACGSISNLTDTSFECVTGAHAADTALTITVTNLEDGQQGSGGSFDYKGPPTVTSLQVSGGGTTINGGNINGGNTVRFIGTDFETGMTGTVGSATCTPLTVVDGNNAECSIPAASYSADTVDITVTNLDTQTSTATDLYTFREPPIYTSIDVAFAPVSGGTTVTITGDYFLSNIDVAIDNTPCNSVNFIDAQTVECVTPAHALEASLNIDIKNIDDDQSVTASGVFSYVDVPVITSFTPTTIWEAGSQSLTITGTNLLAGASVTIDNNPCTVTSQTAPTDIICDTPAGSGTVTVVVTNADGQTGSTNIDYLSAPTITSYDYAYGPVAGGNTITVFGTGFQTGPTFNISIGGSDCNPTTYVDVDEATCVVPAGSIGIADVVLTNEDGQAVTDLGAFEYIAAPIVSSFNPTSLYETSPLDLTITGSGFKDGATIDIDGNPCGSVTFTDSTELICVTPPNGSGNVSVVVTNPDSQTGSNTIDYIPAPTITSVTGPTDVNEGIEAGGESITIVGTNFLTSPQDPEVTIGGSTCTITSFNTTTIICDTPAGTGSQDVVVTNHDGQSVTFGTQFTYYPPPTLTSISPASSDEAGGISITLTGTGFRDTGSFGISIGGVACTTSTYTNATTAVCQTPAGSAGSVDVVITNKDGQTGTLTDGYTYIGPPVVASFSPTTLYETSSPDLTITGSGFISGATVTIGGAACGSVTFTDSTELICVTPPDGTGSAIVLVTNPDTQFDNSQSINYLPAPTISSVTGPTDDDEGIEDGGESITIAGANFLTSPDPTVTIGGNPCNVTAASSTSITCDTPAGTGSQDVVVTNNDGQSVTFGTQFTYYPPPSITSLSQTGGSVSDVISIYGSDFRDTVNFAATIGGVSCSPSLVDATEITCTVPAGLSGTVNVVVTNKDGQTDTYSSFTYQNGPSITSLSQTNGPESISATITINGADFDASATVDFEGTPCTSLNFIDSTQIQCDTPTGLGAGAKTLKLSNPDNQAATTTYTFDSAPVISGLSASGSAANEAYAEGSQALVITGTGFVSGATVTVAGNDCPVANTSPTQMQCDLPAGSGTQSVVVLNPDAQSDSASLTYINAPTIDSLSITTGAVAGGDALSITGSNFLPGATVSIGGVSCGSATVTSTQIDCTTGNRAAGIVDVVVTNTYDGQAATLATSFTYVDVPTFTSITPAIASNEGGTSVTISGGNFVAGTTIDIDGVACDNIVVSDASTITCDVPASSTIGTVDVEINNPSQAAVVSSDAFEYTAPPPQITSISPQGGSTAGGTEVTITGSDFDPTITDGAVMIGGVSCTSVVATTTEITCTTGARTLGLVDVVVTNADTQNATLSTAFLYATGPSISSVSPAAGPTTGGTTITITGADFENGMVSVTVGGKGCSNVTWIDATEIECDIPTGTVGNADVVVTQYYQSATLEDSFTYTNGALLAFDVGTDSPTPPNPADYGSVSVNTSLTFTVENIGTSSSTAISTAVTGTNAGAFIIQTDTCNNSTLTVGSSCTIQVVFLASFLSAGTYTATLEANSSNSPSTTNDLEGTKSP